ncbi:TPA: class I tRNA ligase family protein [Candidatus Woesearchaeota archaeon]|nr:class I tRNA ligase family protein [Candidatus Woesearchaeota archaeon]
MSRQAAEKLIHQKDNITIKEDIPASTLIGRKALAPGVNREIIILPATFCDPAVGTGIVTSVPSDAPFDYLALKQLQENDPEIQQYHLDPTEIKNIKPISIITTKGYGPLPAQEIIEKYNITSFTDPKLEEENKEIYKAGHHTGILNDHCGKYSSKKVEEAKELVKSDLLDQKKADIFHDLSEEVVCRCGNPVVIKRIDDQWFIRYSDQELTERSKEQVKEMRVFPPEYQENLPGILEWFTDRACARLGNWLGSKFPLDKKWTIEPISDSTLYPAYYIVSKFIKNKTIKTEELTEEFFDFVFLNRGKGKEHWKDIQQEFHYFYPLDLNLGGKEHKTVHFPVFIMNHIAILPEEKWPKGIFINWWVIGKGSKISKSKGGAEPIPNAIEKYGVDAMRLYYAHIGSPHIDVVWTEDVVFNYKNTLERIHTLVEKLRDQKGPKTIIDEWILSRVNQHIVTIDHSMRAYDLRELASTVYFSIYDDLKWYLRRGGKDQKTITEVIAIWAKLMNPISPHVSEEIYNQKDLCSTSSWPTINRSAINHHAEAQEKMLLDTMENMRNVITLAKIESPKKFTLFIAEPWLYNLYKTLSREFKVTRNMGEIMKKVLVIEEFTPQSKEISKIVQSALKDPTRIPPFVLSADEEYTFFNGAKEFLEEEFKCTIMIVKAEDNQHLKAKAAQPGKVGILVE